MLVYQGRSLNAPTAPKSILNSFWEINYGKPIGLYQTRQHKSKVPKFESVKKKQLKLIRPSSWPQFN